MLLLHGFGDTPQTLGYLAEALHARGYTVRAPLLPGHGRGLRAFSRSTAAEWEEMAHAEYAALGARHEVAAIVGLSMGGALGVQCAAGSPELPALVLLSPYLSMPRRARAAALLHRLWVPFAPYLAGGGEASIRDDRERPKSRAYGIVSGRALAQLRRVVRRTWAELPAVRVPTIAVHAREDHRVPVDAAQRAFDRLGAADKRLAWVEGCGHLVTVDHCREEVIRLTLEWIAAHADGAARLRGGEREVVSTGE